MTGVASWRRLRHGDGPVALMVDYGEGRREAGFPELAENLDGTATLLATSFDPAGVQALAVAATTDPSALGAEITRWTDALPSGTPPTVVLGYCAGVSLACLIADRLSGGTPVPVVMLDPVVVTSEFLLRRYGEAAFGFVGLLPEDQIWADVHAAAAQIRSDPAATPTALVGCAGALSRRYRELVGTACEAAGLEDESADDLHAHLAAVLHYQALTGTSVSPDVFGARQRPGRVLCSRNHVIIEPLRGPDMVFDVGRVEFMADRRLAAAVAAIIAGP